MGWHRINRDHQIESAYEACSLDDIIGARQHTDTVLIVGQCRTALENVEGHTRYRRQRYAQREWNRAACMLPIPGSPDETYGQAPMPREPCRRHMKI
jgi:hypothetical protein